MAYFFPPAERQFWRAKFKETPSDQFGREQSQIVAIAYLSAMLHLDPLDSLRVVSTDRRLPSRVRTIIDSRPPHLYGLQIRCKPEIIPQIVEARRQQFNEIILPILSGTYGSVEAKNIMRAYPTTEEPSLIYWLIRPQNRKLAERLRPRISPN